MQRTLNRELKELEVVGREAIVIYKEWLLGKSLYIFGDTIVLINYKVIYDLLIIFYLNKIIKLISVKF